MWYNVAAMAHTSTSGLAYLKLITCCRGINTGVPATDPVRVWPLNPAASNALARPKSATFAIRDGAGAG